MSNTPSPRSSTDVGDVTIVQAGRFLLARTADRAVGLMGVVAAEGQAGLVFPPEIDDAAHAEVIAGLLIEASLQALATSGALFAQLVLPSSESHQAQPFADRGFIHLTDALMLERGWERPAETTGLPLSIVPCDPDRDAVLLESLIAAINRESLDCPELDAWRTPRALLESHRSAARKHPHRWSIYEESGRPVGVSFVFDDEDDGVSELQFFGVIPEARGRGLGAAILCHVAASAIRSRRIIRAAVDSRNGYARSTYVDSGFVETGIAEVWIHSLRGLA